MLYDPSRHTPIKHINWNEEQAYAKILEIYKSTVSHFDSTNLWPQDSKEDSQAEVNKCLYYGAAGTLWALNKIAVFSNQKQELNCAEIINNIYNQYLQAPDSKEIVPSYFIGEAGILLIQYTFNKSANCAERLFKVIESNIENPTLEALWGAPGTMLASHQMHLATNETKWRDLLTKNAEFLIQKLKESIQQQDTVWVQDLYGSKRRFIGAGHGYVGNIFGILKSLNFLEESHNAFILEHISKTLKELAITEDNKTNWPPTLSEQKDTRPPLVQWCHGAPGVITSLESYPIGHDSELEKLLLQAGELIWDAGPLNKGVSLCHGTDGNGYAFLQLYKRTKDELWLQRARAFAMQAMLEDNSRFTLFTGKLGLAMYLISCIDKDAHFPLLDFV